MLCITLAATDDDDESHPSDGVNFSNEDTDSDDENESDDEKEEHPSEYKDQKRYSVAGASVSESVQAKATNVEMKEPKKQSQVQNYDG